MRRRQTVRGRERTDEVLRAASQLFLENGYEKTSLDEIVRRSGGSKSHLYEAFGSKEGLFLAAVTLLCDEVQLSISNLDLSENSVEQGLMKLARAFIAVLMSERHIALHRLVFAEAGRFPEVGRIWFKRGPETTHEIFSEFLERCMIAGTLRMADPSLAANQFDDVLSGHLLDRQSLGLGDRPSRKEINRVTTSAVQLFLFGYSTKREPARTYAEDGQ